jgi:hypothetical protein
MGYSNLRLYTLLFILTLSINNVFSQISFQGRPMGPGYDNNSGIKFIKIERPVISGNNNSNQDSDIKYNKSDRFADNVDVSYMPGIEGSWDTLFTGIYIWRLGLYCSSASSIGLIFTKFHLLPGTKLLIYTPSVKDIIGAFTFRNNNSDNLLALEPLNGDSVIIELQVLKSQPGFGELELGQVGLGFIAFKNPQMINGMVNRLIVMLI